MVAFIGEVIRPGVHVMTLSVATGYTGSLYQTVGGNIGIDRGVECWFDPKEIIFVYHVSVLWRYSNIYSNPVMIY